MSWKEIEKTVEETMEVILHCYSRILNIISEFPQYEKVLLVF